MVRVILLCACLCVPKCTGEALDVPAVRESITVHAAPTLDSDNSTIRTSVARFTVRTPWYDLGEVHLVGKTIGFESRQAEEGTLSATLSDPAKSIILQFKFSRSEDGKPLTAVDASWRRCGDSHKAPATEGTLAQLKGDVFISSTDLGRERGSLDCRFCLTGMQGDSMQVLLGGFSAPVNH
jgi:hypothetical protein